MTSSAFLSRFKGRPAVWSSGPIVMLGLLIATFAVIQAPWPPDPVPPAAGATVSHWDRLRGKLPDILGVLDTDAPDKTVDWYGRRIFDGVVYGLLLAGYVSVGLAAWRDMQWVPAVLTLTGGVGTLYGAALGLYPGPIIVTGGFSLVMFGAGLGWAGLSTGETNQRAVVVGAMTQTGTGFENHGTHSAA
jgi:hypothetical protein